MGQLQIAADGEACRRVGLGILGVPGMAWLDWVRVYSYPVESIIGGGLFQPFPPLTGDRRY